MHVLLMRSLHRELSHGDRDEHVTSEVAVVGGRERGATEVMALF